MAEAAITGKEKIIDKGLEEGAARLTEDKISDVINRVLHNETGARLKYYVKTCVHCGLCSDASLVFETEHTSALSRTQFL